MSDALTKLDENHHELIEMGRCGRPTQKPGARYSHCRKAAGANTKHEGTGACWLHEGSLPDRYEGIKEGTIAALQAEMEEDPQPLNTIDDIALVRALLIDHINRYYEFRDALFEWHKSYQTGATHSEIVHAIDRLCNQLRGQWDPYVLGANLEYQLLSRYVITALGANPKPINVVDITDAIRYLDTISKMVERVGKRMDAQSISRKDFLRSLNEISNIVDQYVQDDQTKMRIKDAFAKMKFG